MRRAVWQQATRPSVLRGWDSDGGSFPAGAKRRLGIVLRAKRSDARLYEPNHVRRERSQDTLSGTKPVSMMFDTPE
jgi:hypothetical protein